MVRLSLFTAWPILLVAFGIRDQAPSKIPVDNLPKTLSLDESPLGLGRLPKTDATPARIALGRRLFFDPILSADNSVACASCHQPDHGFTHPDGRPRGLGGKPTPRRVPSLFNRAYGTTFFWDGRAKSLDEQALEPIANPDEMGSSVAEAIGRLKAHAAFREQFAEAFADGVSEANLGKALAAFERTLMRGDSPLDRFRQLGDRGAMTDVERHGLWLYESKGQCWRCHSDANFTDESFHNTGVSWGASPPDLGRFTVTKNAADRGKFKTPTLRGVKLTAPYMHDGSIKSLDEVIEFYNRGGGANPNLDPHIRPLHLDKNEVNALVAFLKCL